MLFERFVEGRIRTRWYRHQLIRGRCSGRANVEMAGTRCSEQSSSRVSSFLPEGLEEGKIAGRKVALRRPNSRLGRSTLEQCEESASQRGACRPIAAGLAGSPAPASSFPSGWESQRACHARHCFLRGAGMIFVAKASSTFSPCRHPAHPTVRPLPCLQRRFSSFGSSQDASYILHCGTC